MKKLFFLTLGLLLSFVGAQAQGVWEYDAYDPYVIDASQISTNCWEAHEVSSDLETCLGYIIDDNTSTYFHSNWCGAWDDDDDEGYFPYDYHWLQFDLGEELDSVLFHYEPRANSAALNQHAPSDIDIYMTNDPDDDDSWTLVWSVEGIWAYDASETATSYTSEAIVPDQPYRYVRFVVKKTSTSESSNNLPSWSLEDLWYDSTNDVWASIALTWPDDYFFMSFFVVSELNWYKPVWNEDQEELLLNLIDSIADLDLSFTTGTDPGYYDADAVTAYEEALAAAEDGVEEGGLTDEEYYALAQALRQALTDVLAAINPAVEGYYYIVSGASWTGNDEETYEVISRTMAMSSDGDGLNWEEYDRSDYYQVFQLISTASGNFYLYHPATETYAYGQSSQSVQITMTSTPDVETIFDAQGDGLFAIYSTLSSYGYHTAGHSSGSGTSGTIVGWSTTYDADTRNVWYLQTVDTDTLAQMEADNVQVLLDAKLQVLVDSANLTYTACFTYDYDEDTTNGIITSTSQFSSNYPESSEGSYEYLIDGETSTGYYHSSWSANYTDYHYMQVALDEPIEKFILAVFSRVTTTTNLDTPSKIHLYGTNDATLGVDSLSDTDEWTEICTFTVDVEMESGSKNYSSGIDLDGSYQYLRFVVEETASGRSNGSGYTSYFTCSEFQLLDYELNEEQSQYTYIEGLATEVDAMMALAAAAETALEEGTATQDMVDELRAQIQLVRSMMITTDEYDALADEAAELLEGAVIGDAPGSVSQEAYDALEAAVAEAEETANLDYPTKESLAAAVEILEAALEAYKAAVVGFSTDVWYYITVAIDDDDEDEASYYGRSLYMAAGELYGESKTEMLRHGGVDDYGDMTEDAQLDPRYMWRLVEAENGGYYLINRGAGVGIGENDGGLAYASDEDLEIALTSVGNGKFTITYENESGSTYGFYMYGYYEALWLAASGYIGTSYPRSLWKFTEVTEPEYIISYAQYDNLRVQTLPYNVDGYNSNGNEATAYAVVSMTSDGSTTEVGLKAQDSFAAGEPFVVIAGDYDAYVAPAEADTVIIILNTPTDFTTTPGTSNGLVGTYVATSVTKEGYGYISYDDGLELLISDEDAFSVETLGGYFVPTDENSDDAELTLIFEDGEITAVIPAVAIEAATETEAVYDLQGRQVSKADKGIYIIGGKKVIK